MLELPNVTLICVAEPSLAPFLFAANVCRHYCRFGDVKILSSQTSSAHEVVRIPRLNYDEYSRFVIKELHNYVSTPYALVFQADGFVLEPGAWTDEFLEYDYIGAPFWYDGEFNVGNGGFSLRSKRLLLATSEYVNGPPWTPEDHIVCRKHGAILKENGIRFAPTQLARRFSKDGNPREGCVWDEQFGFHNFRTTDLSNWVCPDSVDVNPQVYLQRIWELEQRMATSASAFRGQLRQYHRKQQSLQRQLSSLQGLLRSGILEAAAVEAGFPNGTKDLSKEELQDLAVEVFSDRPAATGLGILIRSGRRSGASPVKVDCDKRLAVCRALCCALQVRLTKEEIDNPCFCLDVERPFSLERDQDTRLCKHWKNDGCQVYENRPDVCAGYTCINDSRIWEDFDRMILSPRAKKALEKLATGAIAPSE